MRREIRARWLAAITALAVIALAALFAALRNAPAAPSGALPGTRLAAADYISLQTLRTPATRHG